MGFDLECFDLYFKQEFKVSVDSDVFSINASIYKNKYRNLIAMYGYEGSNKKGSLGPVYLNGESKNKLIRKIRRDLASKLEFNKRKERGF